ncbi:MAG: alpha/beta hydrolase [Oscillospiraceae bacterium]|nr:alpha/beta hydrolase [Oscillospiraceae bacterium]
MNLHPENLFKDPDYREPEEFPNCDALDIMSHGCHLYGYTMLPGGKAGEKRPLVLMLHGFPGHTTNHDLAQALRRMGCVVVNPFYRGAWGSEGYYTFSGLIEDAVTVAEWARSKEIAEKYHIDTENIFLAGHSMGGFTCINTLRRLPWIRGGVCMAPYDMPWFFEHGQEETFRALLTDGSCLRQETPTSMYEDAVQCYQGLGFSQAYEDLKNRNLYFIGAKKDCLALPCDMIEPLWKKLSAHHTDANQRYDLIDSDHSFSDRRITMCTQVGDWIAAVVGG